MSIGLLKSFVTEGCHSGCHSGWRAGHGKVERGSVLRKLARTRNTKTLELEVQ
jgi:hypothetical protein